MLGIECHCSEEMVGGEVMKKLAVVLTPVFLSTISTLLSTLDAATQTISKFSSSFSCLLHWYVTGNGSNQEQSLGQVLLRGQCI